MDKIELTLSKGKENMHVFCVKVANMLCDLDDGEYKVIIQDKPKHRSKDANSYLWVLCDEIAIAMSRDGAELYTKEDIYRKAIREVGVFRDIDTNLMDETTKSQTMSLLDGWSRIGIGWFTEELDEGVYRRYYGSSSYNTKSMKRILDSIVADAKALGIQTETPDEIAKMEALWRSQL